MTDAAWLTEAMRLLDLFVRGYMPYDRAASLVEKYRLARPDEFIDGVLERMERL